MGASPTGSGHTPLSFDTVTRELQGGDWVYIDNGGAAGHSVIFVEWASDTKHESDTAPETGETRQVSYRVAHTYSQRKPKLGGTFDTYKIGFPYSKKHKVYPAYSIVNARQDAQVASSSEQLLNYDVDEALSANGAILGNEKLNLDAAAVRQKLHGVVQGLVSGMHEQHRTQDHKGEARGDFSAPQRAVVDAILAGSGNVERDIADLVALGQKLSLINVVHGDPTRPNGKLAQGMSGGTWTAPWPAWGKDPALRKQP